MGTFSPGIFDNDVALDVRASAEAALEEGLDMAQVTARVVAEYSDYLDDFDDGPLVWLALAALQLEHNAVQPEVRRQALAVIESGAALDRWEESGEMLRERQRVLGDLKARLKSASAPEEQSTV